MSMLKTVVPKPGPALAAPFRSKNQQERRQRELMVGSLCILLLALGILLWHDRDFWVPPDETDVEPPASVEVVPAAKMQSSKPFSIPLVITPPAAKSSHKTVRRSTMAVVPSQVAAATTDDESGIKVTSRTVLPPLNVEVVAGNTHRIVQPGNNALHVDLQPAAGPQPAVEAPETETAASLTTNAAESIQMSANSSSVVASEVRPNYPLLARQMRVQGRVILLALIGKDGVIQHLNVVSGPPILASAAEDAVRQWHFKPHIEGNETVETQAKITVNFTISTN